MLNKLFEGCKWPFGVFTCYLQYSVEATKTVWRKDEGDGNPWIWLEARKQHVSIGLNQLDMVRKRFVPYIRFGTSCVPHILVWLLSFSFYSDFWVFSFYFRGCLPNFLLSHVFINLIVRINLSVWINLCCCLLFFMNHRFERYKWLFYPWVKMMQVSNNLIDKFQSNFYTLAAFILTSRNHPSEVKGKQVEIHKLF